MEKSMAINFFGTLQISDALFPLLREGARVVNVGSMAGSKTIFKSNVHLDKLMSDSLSREELVSAVREFVDAAKRGANVEEGWPATAYGTSKVGLFYN